MGFIFLPPHPNITSFEPNRIITTSVYQPNQQHPYYHIDIIDYQPCEIPIGIYVVQQGKESEYFYSTTYGKLEVAQEMNFSRLLLVVIDYHHPIVNISTIQSELIAIAHHLSHTIIPPLIIPIRTDLNGVGTRQLLFEKLSKYNGIVWVEESWLDSDDDTFSRKLLFSGERSLVQSEGITKSGKILLSESIATVSYFKGIICGLKMLWGITQRNVLVCGGGANILANGIKEVFNRCTVTSVEIDQVVADAAQTCFDVGLGITTIVDDALNVIKLNSYEAIIIDIDNKVTNEFDVAAPHPNFTTDEAIIEMKQHCDGLFPVIIFNVVVRRKEERNALINKIAKHFDEVYKWKCDEDVNILLFCYKEGDVDLLNQECDDDDCIDFINNTKRIK
ncbi:Spermine/spermidine synthase family protein [Entamoeba marina]